MFEHRVEEVRANDRVGVDEREPLAPGVSRPDVPGVADPLAGLVVDDRTV